MFFMTAKLDLKKILIILAAAALLIIGVLAIFGGSKETVATGAGTVSGNDARVNFLKELGWQVSASPVESSQVRIPKDPTELYDRYNALQKSLGYDLSSYAGKAVMRYVYKVHNFPGATEPVYATLLVHKNKVIGGDVTDTSAKGVMQGLSKAPAPETTQPVKP
ncbi:MAG: DUF4830 domain-containing protein [Oscillospiraceae bacterium]|nr:DUF4830 domain-containing protein [Oscillospiraceae bacterium]MBQ7000235.1 DUF4830 domain-containing protein [Oscillospiraceae bacterium]